MTRHLRRIALVLLAVLGFAQASLVLADCDAERGALARMLAPAAGEACGDCGMTMSDSGAVYANRCVAHCTADLQLSGPAVAIVRAPANVPVLHVEPGPVRISVRLGLEAPPPGAPPSRILLHSFLV